jgi:DUF2975 family protein
MNLTGRWSVVSFLIVLLSILRYTVAIVLVATTAILAFAWFADIHGLDMTVIPPSLGVGSTEHSGWRMRIPVSVILDDQQVSSPSLGIDRVEIQNLRGFLQFPIQRGSFFIVNALFLILGLTVAFWVMTELHGVLRTVRDGQPFALSNASRLRKIAWAVIAGEFIRTGIVYFENAYAASNFFSPTVTFAARADFSIFAIFEGFLILVIAEVFRAGTRLDEEQSLTV